MAMSPIRASRCCSKYVFSGPPAWEKERWCEDILFPGCINRINGMGARSRAWTRGGFETGGAEAWRGKVCRPDGRFSLLVPAQCHFTTPHVTIAMKHTVQMSDLVLPSQPLGFRHNLTRRRTRDVPRKFSHSTATPLWHYSFPNVQTLAALACSAYHMHPIITS